MTLSRSRSHRTAWLAYIGGAAAILLNSSVIDGALFMKGTQTWRAALDFLVLFWPLAASAVLLPGLRHVMRIPSELPANWVFQLTESRGRRAWMPAVERFTVISAIAPVFLLLAPLSVYVLGWEIALRMTILQIIAALTMFEVLFYSWQQLPFTCSYVPGRKPLILVLTSYIATLGVLVPLVTVFIATAARWAPMFGWTLAIFAAAWLKARSMRREGWGEAKILYEDLPAAVNTLGIDEMNRSAGGAGGSPARKPA